MRLNITARHFKLTDKIRNYVSKEVEHLSKYYDGIIDMDVILEWEKKDRIAEIKANVFHTVLSAEKRSDDIYLSIHGAVEKMERQLIKYKDRLHGFEHAKAPREIALEENSKYNEGELSIE